jgi:DNA-3-methyladenine glycosylase
MIGFLARPAPAVAPELIGWRLQVGTVEAEIAETEAYHGEEDLACHAAKGRTPRTMPLYGAPGTLYVYLCYGLHHLLNLVTDQEGMPSAVLIRGVVIAGLDPRRSNGPGKVAKLLGLDRRHHGEPLGRTLRLLPPTTTRGAIRSGPRVGVAYAGPLWAGMPWRWWREGFPAVRP